MQLDEVTLMAKRESVVARLAIVSSISQSAATVLTREMSMAEILDAANRIKDGKSKIENMKIVDC
jgi:hypothetical protein